MFHFHSSLTPRWIKENKNLTIPPDGTREEEEEKKNPPHIFIRDERGGERESRRKVFIDPREGAQRVCLCTLSRVKKSHNVPHIWEELRAVEGGAIRSTTRLLDLYHNS